MTTKAVVTTVLNPPSCFSTWVDYHLQRFDKIYLFLDSAEELNNPNIPDHKNLIVLQGAKASNLYKDTESNKMSRQILNVEKAIEFCQKDNITWLLHIDADEIFYDYDCPNWADIALAWGLGAISFTNHEAIPVWETNDFFKTCQYFRFNGKTDFIGYCNGKSAGRVSLGIRPHGVHHFTGFREGYQIWLSPCILHYPSATYQEWLIKYERMGEIGIYWFDNPSLPITTHFNADSRRLYNSCKQLSNFIACENFYKSNLLDEKQLADKITKGEVGIFKPFKDSITFYSQDWFSYNIPHWETLLKEFKDQPDIIFCEVGSFEGRATVWLLENVLTHPTARITCIDTFQGRYDHQAFGIDCSDIYFRFKENTAKFANKVSILNGYSMDSLKKFDQFFDFIYIDSSHVTSDVLVDAVLGWIALKHGGIMLFDDYQWDGLNSIQHRPSVAIDAFLTSHIGKYELLYKDYQLAVKKT